MLLESFFGGFWDLRAQNAGGRANGDIIPVMKSQDVAVRKKVLMMFKNKSINKKVSVDPIF